MRWFLGGAPGRLQCPRRSGILEAVQCPMRSASPEAIRNAMPKGIRNAEGGCKPRGSLAMPGSAAVLEPSARLRRSVTPGSRPGPSGSLRAEQPQLLIEGGIRQPAPVSSRSPNVNLLAGRYFRLVHATVGLCAPPPPSRGHGFPRSHGPADRRRLGTESCEDVNRAVARRRSMAARRGAAMIKESSRSASDQPRLRQGRLPVHGCRPGRA
jgi:hypothetical protein